MAVSRTLNKVHNRLSTQLTWYFVFLVHTCTYQGMVDGQCDSTTKQVLLPRLTTVVVKNPGYPNSYPRDSNCVWDADIRPSQDYILLQVKTENVRCATDSVSVIYDHRLRENFCGGGQIKQQYIVAKQGRVMVRFFSSGDKATETKRFHIFFIRLPNGENLAKELNETVVTSPSFPDPYEPSLMKTWKIEVPVGFQIKLTLQFIDIENDDDNCEYDYFQISTESETYKLCDEFQFEQVSDVRKYTFFTNISITLKSDDSTQKRGFALSYKKFRLNVTETRTEIALSSIPSIDTGQTIGIEKLSTISTREVESTPRTINISSQTTVDKPLHASENSHVSTESFTTVPLTPEATSTETRSTDFHKTTADETTVGVTTSEIGDLTSNKRASLQESTMQYNKERIITQTSLLFRSTMSSKLTTSVTHDITSSADFNQTIDRTRKTGLVNAYNKSIIENNNNTALNRSDVPQIQHVFESNNNCHMSDCVIPLIIATTLLLGIVGLLIIILGTVKHKKRKRMYNIAPMAPPKLPTVEEEYTSEEASL